MKSFADSTGLIWTITLNVNAVKRVRESALKLDLTNLTDGTPPLLQRLSLDVCLLCDVLYVLCEPQAIALGVTDEQFGAAMGGEGLQHGGLALMEELALFFQSLGRREVTRMIEKNQTLTKLAVEAAENRLAAIDPNHLVSQLMSTNSAGSSPASSASTPALTPSANSSG